MTIDHTLAGHGAILITLLVDRIYAWFREGRRHRWQQEQFNRMSREMKNGGAK